MAGKIAMGVHTCVDYELIWNTEVVEKMIRKFDIHADELDVGIEVHTERDAWVYCLAHLQAGIGGEIVPDESATVNAFAEQFEYKVTLGGTPARAAIVLDKLGYDTILQTSCWNRYVEELLPEHVAAVPGAPFDEVIYPHAVLQCSQGVHIKEGDIDFVTPRENRLMISRDLTSLDLPILPDVFGPQIEDAEVFLLGCFSEILDKEILEKCVDNAKKLLDHLPEEAAVMLEDGCYVVKDYRYYVLENLRPYIDVISMNEDEMQDFIGKKINILDVDAVADAVKHVYDSLGFKILIIHSAKWALAYGPEPERFLETLKGGATMAATRFRIGDDITKENYEETSNMPDREDAAAFCKAIKESLGEMLCIIPSKDLSHIEHPTVVGLGDSFAGGCLPGLAGVKRTKKN